MKIGGDTCQGLWIHWITFVQVPWYGGGCRVGVKRGAGSAKPVEPSHGPGGGAGGLLHLQAGSLTIGAVLKSFPGLNISA